MSTTTHITKQLENQEEVAGGGTPTKFEDVKNLTTEDYFGGNQFSIDAFKSKYSLINKPDETYVQAIKRVCDYVASVEKTDKLREYWSDRWFHEIFNDWWHPAGSIMQGAGSGRKISLANCNTVSLGVGLEGEEWDSLEAIIKNTAYTVAKSAAYRQGVGVDFSRLRPNGAVVQNSARESTGSIHWMQFIDQIGYFVGQKGRIPALLFSLSCKHPDVEEFIKVKSDRTKIQNANISVQCTDDFYKAVKDDKDWDLCFEIPETKTGQKVYVDVHSTTMECKKDEKGWYYLAHKDHKKELIKKTVRAKQLMELIAKNMFANAEPGIQNIDIARKYSNSDYVYDSKDEYDSRIIGTNACCIVGESKILTNKGWKTIKEMYTLYTSGFTDLMALSYNVKEDNYEMKPIVNVWQQRNDKTVELEIEENDKMYKIECSADHPIATRNRGYVAASSLTEDDDIMIFT